jgi:hypothetical protein
VYWYPVGVNIGCERLDRESESKKCDDTDHYQDSDCPRGAVVRVIRVSHVDKRCQWLIGYAANLGIEGLAIRCLIRTLTRRLMAGDSYRLLLSIRLFLVI